MARGDRITRRRRSRSNNSSGGSSGDNSRRRSSNRRNRNYSRKRSSFRSYYENDDDESGSSSSSSTDEDNSNIFDEYYDDIIWLEDDNSRRSRPLRKAIENACEEFEDREYNRRIFKFILQDQQLDGYKFYSGRSKRNIHEIRSTKELEAHIYEIYEEKRRQRRKDKRSSSSRDIMKKKDDRQERRRSDMRKRGSNGSKRSYSGSSSGSEAEEDIEMGGTKQQQQRRRRRQGRRRSSSRDINESPERSDAKTNNKKTTNPVSARRNMVYSTGGAFRLFVRKTVRKFDSKPYSRDIFKHIKSNTKEMGLPIVITKYRGEDENNNNNRRKEAVNKSELMDAINNIYDEERYMVSKAKSTHIYFDYPNHIGTRDWKIAVRMVVASNLKSHFGKQTLAKIENRLPPSHSYFVGRPPTCINATRNDIMERSYEQFEIEKRRLQMQLENGYLQRYRILGNIFWRKFSRQKCSSWIRTKCGQCRRGITNMQCCLTVKQTLLPCTSKIRHFCKTDPKTGQDVYQKIFKQLEVTMFGHTSSWPLIIVLGCAAATIITLIIYHVLKNLVFNVLSWERCAVFLDTTICGGSNLGEKQ